jgi:hypothetical protein
MHTRKGVTSGLALIMTLLSLGGGLALAGDRMPMTPEMAAKKEMVRKQQQQRVTHRQKKEAADALKAERLKIYRAKQAARQLNPNPIPQANQ